MNFEDLLVSASPDRIYHRAGSLFEFHEKVRDSAGPTQAGIEYLFTLYRSAYYRHTAVPDMIIDSDDQWGKTLLKSYNRERHCHAAASVVVRISDAVIDDSTIHCYSGGSHSILYETVRFPDRAGKLIRSPIRDNITRLDDDNRSYLYVGSAGSFNYGHWLVDDLPRIKAWVELRKRLGITCAILLPSHGNVMDTIRLQSMRTLIDPMIKAKFINPKKTIAVRNLYFATPVSFHPRIKNPSAIHFVQSSAAARFATNQAEPYRKLFVARRPPNSRAITNFNALWSFLSDRGFEMMEPEKHAFAEQVTMFQEARIVVGQMGAAMTGTIFCRPATNILYLAPIGWAEPFYLDLAAVAGQQYDILAGPTTGEGQEAYLSDFIVPLEPLHHRLSYIGYGEFKSS